MKASRGIRDPGGFMLVRARVRSSAFFRRFSANRRLPARALVVVNESEYDKTMYGGLALLRKATHR